MDSSERYQYAIFVVVVIFFPFELEWQKEEFMQMYKTAPHSFVSFELLQISEILRKTFDSAIKWKTNEKFFVNEMA